MNETIEERAAAAGRTTEHQAEFERGRQAADERIKALLEPQPVQAPSEPAYLAPQQFRALAPGDRGKWQKDTLAGQLRHVMVADPPDEQRHEAEAARLFADNYELTYGRRPSLAAARFAVARRGDGVAFAGLDEFTAACRAAGIQYQVRQEFMPLPAEPDIVHQPVTR
jgi:hypothetical protein